MVQQGPTYFIRLHFHYHVRGSVLKLPQYANPLPVSLQISEVGWYGYYRVQTPFTRLWMRS